MVRERVSRRALLCGCATTATAAMAGCANPLDVVIPQRRDITTTVSVDESPYIADVNTNRVPTVFFADRLELHVELARSPPQRPDFVALMRDGKQDDVHQTVTGETRFSLRTSILNPDELDELLLVEGGEYQGGKARHGDVLARVDIEIEVHR